LLVLEGEKRGGGEKKKNGNPGEIPLPEKEKNSQKRSTFTAKEEKRILAKPRLLEGMPFLPEGEKTYSETLEQVEKERRRGGDGFPAYFRKKKMEGGE